MLQCDVLADRILALANTISAAALNLNELEPVTLGRTLSTYKLTRLAVKYLSTKNNY